MSRIALALAIWAFPVSLLAQSNHHLHHSFYNGWVNQNGKGCCNNQDCGELDDADERMTGGVIAVKVLGEWCPVLPHHYLKRGNVPNASVSHICVAKYMPASTPACERLLCYQPKPLG